MGVFLLSRRLRGSGERCDRLSRDSWTRCDWRDRNLGCNRHREQLRWSFGNLAACVRSGWRLDYARKVLMDRKDLEARAIYLLELRERASHRWRHAVRYPSLDQYDQLAEWNRAAIARQRRRKRSHEGRYAVLV